MVVAAPLASLAQVAAQDSRSGDLAAGFQSPPEPAKARTWWHWMNGVVTKEGMTADLEAMKRVGLAGAYSFNLDQLPIVDQCDERMIDLEAA